MQSLRERILRQGRVLPGGILKVDGFLNGRLDPRLTLEMGLEFKERFDAQDVGEVDKILTAEVSGIAPALATAIAYGVPCVYARKRRPVTMTRAIEVEAPSATKGGTTPLLVSPEFLAEGERVLVIDDFLASGNTTVALVRLVELGRAHVAGLGFVIEKSFAHGRAVLAGVSSAPIVSLARVTALDEGRIELA